MCGMRVWWVAVCWSLAARDAAGRAGGAPARVFAGARGYGVTTALHLAAPPAAGELALQLRSELLVAPLWSPHRHAHAADADPTELIIYFDVRDVGVWRRGKHERSEFRRRRSELDKYPSAPFYAHWRAGRIVQLYLDPSLPTDLHNHQRALASIFQFQLLDGDAKETDVSGECNVVYESLGENEMRKIKSGCRWGNDTEGADDDGAVESRRVTRYSWGVDGLSGVHAEEVHTWAAGGAAGRARAWLRLAARDPLAAPGPLAAADLPAALAALPAHYRPYDLPLQPDDTDTLDLLEEEDEDVPRDPESVLRWAAGELCAEGATAEGAAGAARALLGALTHARDASTQLFDKLLREQIDHQHNNLTCVLWLAGVSGTRAAHAAVSALLGAPPAPARADPPADAYYHALAHAQDPDEWVLLEAARGGNWAGALAAGACGGRQRGRPLAAQIRDLLANRLTKCKGDEECSAVLVRALGSLRRADTAQLLLEQAERGGRGAARAALDALAGAGAGGPGPGALRRLRDVALQLRRPRALDVRAAALRLCVQAAAERAHALAAVSADLAQLAAALQRHGPHELRRLFWLRLDQLAATMPAVRDTVRRMPLHLRSWHARAIPGMSSVVSRPIGEGAVLESEQVSAGGAVRLAAVRLLLAGAPAGAPSGDPGAPALGVHVWTRGLHALAAGAPGDAAEPGEEDEEMSAGLHTQLAGAHQRPVTLFTSQAQLLGLVWAGAGSSATPVVRGALPGAAGAARRATAAGAPLRVRHHAAAAARVEAAAQVSLWSRTAQAQTWGAGAVRGRWGAAAGGAWGRLRARGGAELRGALHIAADTDFYDKPKLCIRVHTDDIERRTWGRWRGGGVARGGAASARPATRTLALGAANDAACRA